MKVYPACVVMFENKADLLIFSCVFFFPSFLPDISCLQDKLKEFKFLVLKKKYTTLDTYLSLFNTHFFLVYKEFLFYPHYMEVSFLEEIS